MKKIILVVDAAPGFVDALVRDDRWDVHTAPAGSAVCRAHDLRPDLLIADVHPGDGLGVARTLGWVSATPSLLLSEVPGPSLADLPHARLVLERSCDGETLLRTVEDLLPA
ncbi:MAG TPA: hypothetical protein VF950_27450 [Planctomycetota bacterium]